MDLQRPLATVTSGVDGDVLGVLAGAHAQFGIPRLHAVIGDHSITGVRNSVRRLVSQGIVRPHGIGRDRVYELNDDHLAAPAIRQLAALRATFFARLRTHLEAWPEPPLFGAVFGSAARGDMTSESDIDIVLARPDAADDDAWLARVASLTSSVAAWTGNDTRIVELSSDDRGEPSLQPLLRSITNEGITVVGDPDWLRRPPERNSTP